MFDLDKAIAFWGSGLEHRRALSEDDLDELEQHLRDHVAALVKGGRPVRAAFREALGAMGDYASAEAEYRKVRWGKLKRERKLKDELAWRFAMLKSYARIAYRTLNRHKGYTAINVLGLAVGMAACLLIGLYVQDEVSYDRFHPKADRIYRAANELRFLEEESQTAITPGLMGPKLLEEVPDFEAFVRLDDYGTQQPILIRRGYERFYEKSFILADSSFFDFFSFPLAAGDPSTALKEPHSVVLTPAMARKYFGEENPLGQTIEVGDLFGEQAFRVTGVLADVPHNTHLRFDFVGSFSTLGSDAERDGWFSLNYLTYVLLRENASPEQVQRQVRAVTERHAGGNEMMQYTPFLQPLTSIHLHSQLENELGPNGDVRYLHLLSAAALVLLLIACINYMNLATARSATRAKEVGMRKVVGASRGQLAAQFLGEAVLLSLAGFGVALALAAAALPFFSALTGKPLGADVGGGFVAGLALSVLAVGLVAGSYPALFLSGLRPALVIRGAAGPATGLLPQGARRGVVCRGCRAHRLDAHHLPATRLHPEQAPRLRQGARGRGAAVELRPDEKGGRPEGATDAGRARPGGGSHVGLAGARGSRAGRSSGRDRRRRRLPDDSGARGGLRPTSGTRLQHGARPFLLAPVCHRYL